MILLFFYILEELIKIKGIIDLIEAFKKIDAIHNSILIFVGPIEDEELTNLIYKKKIFYILNIQLLLNIGFQQQIYYVSQVIEKDLEQWL